MNSLPAVPDTPTVGEVTGRVELVDGQLVIRLRPTDVRDVTTRPVHTEPVHQHYRGCVCRIGSGDYRGLAYQGPLTVSSRAEVRVLRARFLNPPWWSPLAWRPVHRRARTDLLKHPARSLIMRGELETIGKEVRSCEQRSTST